ncbi:DUF1570 domain-containing protein [Brevundimonas sp. AAP58]|uniref:DUF1570 domain-containing protein n=1 Tax=Brevundimonas sp. AAP58 TaxID=1523422 RepID=UPI0006B92294|nr:DUF1570 domain-containing protein [Brevundimonas sp. AAP58]
MSPSRLIALTLVVLGMLGLTNPARAEWLRAETDHFVIYGDTSERSITAYARKLETFDALLRAYYPFPIDHDVPKLDIYMANGTRDMLRAEPDIGGGVLGFYSPNSIRIHAVADVSSEMSDDVIFHEYAHHFMFQMPSGAYPAWFIEGFAEYWGTVRIRGDVIQIGRHNPGRVNSLTQPANSWPPMEDVLRWRVLPSGRYRGSDYYAIAWALTHYMLSTPERTRQLGQYLLAVAGGQDPVAALSGTIDRTPAQLANDVRRYVAGPINYLTPQIDLPQPRVSVTRLPVDQADLVWIDLRLDRVDPRTPEPTLEQREGETDAAFTRRRAEALDAWRERRAQLIADAERAAARHGDSPWGRLISARAERLAGRPGEAIEILRPIAGPEADDPKALRAYAAALMDVMTAAPEDADLSRMRSDARGALAQALDLNPLDFQTYLEIDRLRQGQPGYPNENDASVLDVAVTLAPQSFDARLRLARVLMVQGQALQAIHILQPVANSPHGGASRQRGRALLAEAQQQAGLAVSVAEDSPPPEEGEFDGSDTGQEATPSA